MLTTRCPGEPADNSAGGFVGIISLQKVDDRSLGNAPMESFFATLKSELVHHCHFQTRDQAKQAIFEYIELFYNRRRLHSALDYQSPVEFEALFRPF